MVAVSVVLRSWCSESPGRQACLVGFGDRFAVSRDVIFGIGIELGQVYSPFRQVVHVGFVFIPIGSLVMILPSSVYPLTASSAHRCQLRGEHHCLARSNSPLTISKLGRERTLTGIVFFENSLDELIVGKPGRGHAPAIGAVG